MSVVKACAPQVGDHPHVVEEVALRLAGRRCETISRPPGVRTRRGSGSASARRRVDVVPRPGRHDGMGPRAGTARAREQVVGGVPKITPSSSITARRSQERSPPSARPPRAPRACVRRRADPRRNRVAHVDQEREHPMPTPATTASATLASIAIVAATVSITTRRWRAARGCAPCPRRAGGWWRWWGGR